jgi:Tol biopolymer transport system component
MRKNMMMILALVVILTLPLAFAQKDPRAEAQLQAAINKETVEGNLKGAIEQYKKLAKSPNRPVAAKALLHLGECYEKQGNTEARKTFEKLIGEYKDQPEVVAQASIRLNALGVVPPKSTDLLFRKAWTGPEIDIVGPPSPDGRYIAYVDKDTFDLGIHDLTTGSNRRLTHRDVKAKEFEMALEAAWSPDGMRLAYSWFNKEGNWDLRVIDLDGSNLRVVTSGRDLYGWFPDGKSILASVKSQFCRIAVDSGFVQNLSISQPLGTPVISPDGQFIAYMSSKQENRADRDIFVVPVDGGTTAPIFTEKSNESLWGWDAAGRSILFTSDRSGSFGLWRIAIVGGKPHGEPELVKSDLGRVWPLGSTRKGSFFYQNTGTASDVFIAEIDLKNGKVITPPVRVNPSHIGFCTSSVWSPDGEFIAYLAAMPTDAPFANSINIVSVKNPMQKEFRTGFAFAGVSHLNWDPNGKFISAIDASVKPRLLRLNVGSGEISILAQLESPPLDWTPDAKTVFMLGGSSGIGYTTIIARNLETGTETQLYRSNEPVVFLGLGSRPLSPDGKWLATKATVLDKQKQPSSNVLLAIPTGGGAARELITLKLPQSFSPLGWVADSKSMVCSMRSESQDNVQLWKISLEGGAPQKLDLTSPSIGYVSFHPDGKRITFTSGGTNPSEIWVMENLPPLKSAGK